MKWGGKEMAEGWDQFFSYVYFFGIIPCVLYYKMVSGLTKRLNSGGLGFIKISPEKFYNTFVKPKNIITFSLLFLSHWFLITIFLIFITGSNKIDGDFVSFSLHFILVYVLWRILSLAQYILFSYISHSYEIILLNVFKCYDSIDDENARYISLNGIQNHRMISLLNSDIRKLRDFELRELSSIGLIRSIFSDKIYMRLYALQKYYNQNPEIEPSEVESNIFLKSNGLTPGFWESIFIHNSSKIRIVYCVYLFAIMIIINRIH